MSTSGADASFEIELIGGGVMLDRGEGDICFTGRQNLGSKTGLPKIARRFTSVAEAQAFCALYKVRNVRIVGAK